MLWPQTNRKISEVFEHGILPTMVYMYKQAYEVQELKRPLHRHESICELILVYEGSGVYLLEGKEYPCRKGSVILYNQGDLHEVASNPEEKIGTYCIGIANLRKKGYPENFLYKKGESFVRNSGTMFPTLKNICDQIYMLEDGGDSGNLVAQLLCASFILLADQLEDPQTEQELDQHGENMVLRINAYLNQHFTEPLTLAEIAKELSCSETYISHLYKRVTGMTPIQYAIRRRIGFAQTLLISTELSVTQISIRVGYDNANYFSTLFSKQVGMSPAKYRKMYQSEVKGMKNQI